MITAATAFRSALMTGLSETALTTCGVAKPSDIYEAIESLPDLKLSTICAAAKRGMEHMHAYNTLQSTFGALVEKTIATYNLFYQNGAARALRKATRNYNYEALLTDSSFGRLGTIGLIHSLLSKYQKDRPSQRSYLRQGVASLISLGLAGTATLILCNKTTIFGSRQVTPLDIANDLGSIILFKVGIKALSLFSQVFAKAVNALDGSTTHEETFTFSDTDWAINQLGREVGNLAESLRSHQSSLRSHQFSLKSLDIQLKHSQNSVTRRLDEVQTDQRAVQTELAEVRSEIRDALQKTHQVHTRLADTIARLLASVESASGVGPLPSQAE